jgi:hypothetical protein
LLYRAPAGVWSLDRADELVLDSGGLRLLATYAVLAANFALLLVPPAVASLALLGVIR